jgi:hypothetical protein
MSEQVIKCLILLRKFDQISKKYVKMKSVHHYKKLLTLK